jgi:hypothetical protein
MYFNAFYHASAVEGIEVHGLIFFKMTLTHPSEDLLMIQLLYLLIEFTFKPLFRHDTIIRFLPPVIITAIP